MIAYLCQCRCGCDDAPFDLEIDLADDFTTMGNFCKTCGEAYLNLSPDHGHLVSQPGEAS